ncbi:MAG TPA: MFS transporter [Polyangia bacterium]|nr:MFS transporter [Polyangia bacterium]
MANAEPSSKAKSKKDLLWTSTTYFGEGLPWSFLHQLSTEFLTAIGSSKEVISSTSGFHLATTFKFLWSPLVDLFGRKRTWLWVMQLLLGLGMLVIASIARNQNLKWFWIAGSVLAVMHAIHDIACDAFYMQALNRQGQKDYAGTRNAAFRAAMLIGKSGLVILAGLTTFFLGFAVAGLLMLLVGAVNAIVMPDPPMHHPQDAEPGRPRTSRWAAAVEAYRSFLTQPQILLVVSFMFVHRLGDIMMFAMATPMLKDIGIQTTQRGILTSIGYVGFGVGAVVSGRYLARLGLERCLVPMTYLQNFAIPLYILLPVLKPGFWGVLPVVVAEQIASGLGTAANTVFLLQRCRAAFSASHYAMATIIVSLAITFSGWISGSINHKVGHPMFFFIAFLASVPSLILVHIVPKTPVEVAAPAERG